MWESGTESWNDRAGEEKSTQIKLLYEKLENTKQNSANV